MLIIIKFEQKEHIFSNFGNTEENSNREISKGKIATEGKMAGGGGCSVVTPASITFCIRVMEVIRVIVLHLPPMRRYVVVFGFDSSMS